MSQYSALTASTSSWVASADSFDTALYTAFSFEVMLINFTCTPSDDISFWLAVNSLVVTSTFFLVLATAFSLLLLEFSAAYSFLISATICLSI